MVPTEAQPIAAAFFEICCGWIANCLLQLFKTTPFPHFRLAASLLVLDHHDCLYLSRVVEAYFPRADAGENYALFRLHFYLIMMTMTPIIRAHAILTLVLSVI